MTKTQKKLLVQFVFRLGNAPNAIEASFEQDNVPDPDDPSKVPAFEMRREAARGYRVNKRVQSEAKARLAATNTFRQRIPPYAGPRVRGYRAQEVRWADKVNVQDTDQGEEGFLQGGGMAAYQDSEGMPKVARTAKVQVVPRG